MPLCPQVNAYVPNSGDGLKRLDYRVQSWDKGEQGLFLLSFPCLPASQPPPLGSVDTAAGSALQVLGCMCRAQPTVSRACRLDASLPCPASPYWAQPSRPM